MKWVSVFLVDTLVSLLLVVLYFSEAETAAVAVSVAVVAAATEDVAGLTGDGWVLVRHIHC